jgi:hypothetical protein
MNHDVGGSTPERCLSRSASLSPLALPGRSHLSDLPFCLSGATCLSLSACLPPPASPFLSACHHLPLPYCLPAAICCFLSVCLSPSAAPLLSTCHHLQVAPLTTADLTISPSGSILLGSTFTLTAYVQGGWLTVVSTPGGITCEHPIRPSRQPKSYMYSGPNSSSRAVCS